MIIHTINFNYIETNNLIPNLKIWKNDDIKIIIQEKYKTLEKYYNDLIFNKSRENIAKIILLYEYGGLYINYYYLSIENKITKEFINKLNLSEYDIIFYKDIYQHRILNKIYDTSYKLLTNNIIYVKKENNELFKYIIDNLNTNEIPINEYQNKLYLGNIYLTIQVYEYCNKNNINLENYKIINFIKKIFTKNENKKLIKIEDNIFKEEYDNNIKILTKDNDIFCPIVIDLVEPDDYLINWDNTFLYLEIFIQIIFLILFNFTNIKILFTFLVISTVIELILYKILINQINIEIKTRQNDNRIFFNHRKFKFFKELKNNWKIIAEEAKTILQNAPILNINRAYNEWDKSLDFINTIKDNYGWIKAWKNVDEIKINEKGNDLWLNYGLIYFGIKFTENVSKCPKTIEILDKIIDKINICGFSLLKGNCVLEPHTDSTGIQFNSLAFHLGLIVPQPNSSCKLIIKDNDEYIYRTEKEGEIIIFDPSYEHYAYNQTMEDRIVLYMDFKI